MFSESLFLALLKHLLGIIFEFFEASGRQIQGMFGPFRSRFLDHSPAHSPLLEAMAMEKVAMAMEKVLTYDSFDATLTPVTRRKGVRKLVC